MNEAMHYSSSVEISSQAIDGVQFSVRRISFGRRLELTRRVRELSKRMEFAEAGATFSDKVEASLLAMEVDRLYLEWGVEAVTGIDLDGEAATVDALFDRGPEALCREMVKAVKTECGLSEDERKN